MTRLPLALPPQDDESWPSYLTRTAAQHGTTLAGLGVHLGLRDHRGRWPGRFGVALAADDLHRIAPMLSLAPVQVERMQLAAYDQLAFDLDGLAEDPGIAGTRAAVHSAWVWLAGSTFCPRCLDEDDGVWRLSWRIPWNTTCLRHEVHLLGSCTDCEGLAGLGNRLHGAAPPRVAVVPDGRRCAGPEPGGGVCGSDLSAQPAKPVRADRLHRAQTMADLTTGRRGHVAGMDYTSLQSLRAWQSAIGIAVRLGVADADGWGRTHRWANPPRDPDLIDRLLNVVHPLIDAPDVVAAADVLGSWCAIAGIGSPHANTFERITQPSVALRPVVDELLRRHGRAHTVIQRRLVNTDGLPVGDPGFGVDDIPQLAWSCALPERLRESTRPDQRILRAVISIILVRMCSDARAWDEAGAALAFPPHNSRNWTRYAFSAKWGIKPDLIDAAGRLASQLQTDPQRRDWRARRRVQGFGASALELAQAPACNQSGGVWCPCQLG